MQTRFIRDMMLGSCRARMLLYAITACQQLNAGCPESALSSAKVALHYQELYSWMVGWFN